MQSKFCMLHAVLHAVGLAANRNDHSMRRSAGGGIPGGRKKLPISLGFKCAYCGGEFGSRAGMDCHRRHRTSIGTPCADPMNSQSMSLTQRGDTYTGTLRLHDTLVVPDDAGQRSSDEDHRPSRSQTPPTPPVQAEPSESSCARSTS